MAKYYLKQLSLKWRVFKLCCPAHLFPNTPRTFYVNIINHERKSAVTLKNFAVKEPHTKSPDLKIVRLAAAYDEERTYI